MAKEKVAHSEIKINTRFTPTAFIRAGQTVMAEAKKSQQQKELEKKS